MQQFLGSVGISIIHNGTVVARKNHQGVIVKVQFFELAEQFSDRPIKLFDGVATHSHDVMTPESRMRKAWDVYVVGCEIHEERLFLMLFYESRGMHKDRVCDVLILP